MKFQRLCYDNPMKNADSHRQVPIAQVEKGRTYFRALDLDVEHFGPLWHLIKIAQLLDTELNRIAAAHGISIADFHLLSALMMEGEALPCANDMAMQLNVSNAALSLRIRRLEKMGAIARRTLVEDRRRTLLAIRPEGERLVRDVGQALEQHVRFIPWFKKLTEQERDLLNGMLGSLHLFLHRDFQPVKRPEETTPGSPRR